MGWGWLASNLGSFVCVFIFLGLEGKMGNPPPKKIREI